MATVSGSIAKRVTAADAPDLSSNIRVDDDYVTFDSWAMTPVGATGVKDDNQPIREIVNTVAGFSAKSSSGNDDFYNRILIEPAALNLGNLLSTQTRQVRLWNGYLSTKTASSFQQVNADGINVVEPKFTPFTLAALEEVAYVVNITPDGPPVINAELTWIIDSLPHSLNITGRRVVVWPFGPDWANGVTESLEWRTDVLRAFDGSEQRRSVRTKARRSFAYQTMTKGRQAQMFENLLWGWQNRTYALPVWTDKARLTSAHLAGDTVLNVKTGTFSFAQGGLAIIYSDADNYEVVEVDAINATSINVLRPLENPWPADTLIYPAVLAHLPTSVASQRYTGGVLKASMMFTCSPLDTEPYTPSAAAPTTYEGIDVLTRQPNWVRPIDNTFDYQFDTVDQLTGAITLDQTDQFSRILRRYSWLLRDREQILDFRELLGRLRGQAKTLWIPSWHLDFTAISPIGSADGFIAVSRNLFAELVGVDTARDRLCIRTEAGQTYYRRITGVSNTGEETRLSIDQVLGVSIPLNQIRAIHLLMRNRLSTDKVDISWRTNEVATVETTFTSVLE